MQTLDETTILLEDRDNSRHPRRRFEFNQVYEAKADQAKVFDDIKPLMAQTLSELSWAALRAELPSSPSWASPALRSSAELGTQLPLVPMKDRDRDTIVRKTTLRPFERATSRPGLYIGRGGCRGESRRAGQTIREKLGELGSWLGELPSWTRRAAQLWGAFFS